MSAWTRHLPWFMVWLTRPNVEAGPPRRARAVLPPPTAALEVRDNYPALEERRSAALRTMFPKLYSWYASRSEWMVAVEVQQYLAGAQNLADLENRIRIIEQRRHFGSG